MASRVEVRRPDVRAAYDRKREAMNVELQRALLDESTRIQITTRAGRDVQGRGFKAYTPAYAKRKADSGRQVITPDLTYSGAMLNAMTSVVERVGNALVGRIFFSDIRQALKARGNQAHRQFFGFSREARARIIDRLKRALGK